MTFDFNVVIFVESMYDVPWSSFFLLLFATVNNNIFFAVYCAIIIIVYRLRLHSRRHSIYLLLLSVQPFSDMTFVGEQRALVFLACGLLYGYGPKSGSAAAIAVVFLLCLLFDLCKRSTMHRCRDRRFKCAITRRPSV